jgi:G3E family GTPase
LIAFNTMLWKEAQLDTCVTVIDLHSFADHVALLQGFGDKFTDGLDQSTPEGRQEGERSIADLLIEQVEFANVIVLNKTDLVSDDEQAKREDNGESLPGLGRLSPLTKWSMGRLSPLTSRFSMMTWHCFFCGVAEYRLAWG